MRRSADELHDALLWLTYLTDAEAAAGPGWPALLAQLRAQRPRHAPSTPRRDALWITAERLPLFAALFPEATLRAAGAHARRRTRRRWRRRRRSSRSCAGASRAWVRPPPRARRLARPAGGAHRRGARGAAGRRLRDARRLHGRGGGGLGVVRAAPAGAHPPLHRQAPARRDRAHRGARLPALPVRMAARDAGRAHGRTGRGGRDPRAAGGLRGAGERLGDRDPARPHQRVRTGVARRAVPGRALRVDAAGAAPRRPRARRGPGARHADRAAGAAQRAPVVEPHGRARGGAPLGRGAARRRLPDHPRCLVLR